MIKGQGGDNLAFKKKTGLPMSPYFSAFKIKWMIQNEKAVKEAYDSNDVLFGNVNTYIIYLLTNGQEFSTDPTNASRMFLMDLETIQYDKELLDLFKIKEEMIPTIKPNAADYGSVSHPEIKGLQGLNIGGSIGDQQGSALGQMVFKAGTTKITFGTGTFLISSTGEQKVDIDGLISIISPDFNPYSHRPLPGPQWEGNLRSRGEHRMWRIHPKLAKVQPQALPELLYP